jgi:CBS domain-containing protein
MMIFVWLKELCPTRKVRRLPVLNEDGRVLVGLLSLSDIARDADEEYARKATNRYVTDAESRALGG